MNYFPFSDNFDFHKLNKYNYFYMKGIVVYNDFQRPAVHSKEKVALNSIKHTS